MNKESLKIVSSLKRFLSKDKDISFCYLFGSQAANKTISTSDVDVAVYLNPKIKNFFEKRLELIEKITKSLKKETDVIILNTSSPFLGFVVLKEGKLIFENDKGKRIDFELKKMNEYFDFKPVLEMYNERLLASKK